MKLFQKLLVIFVSLLFFVPIFAQSINLSEFLEVGESDAVIYYPVGWTLNENSLTYYQLVEVEFDLSSGQQPRGVMIDVVVRAKSDTNSGDGSLLGAFETQAQPPRDQTFDPYEIDGMAFPMMRGDAMMPGNVNFSAIVVDVSEEFWLYISIMNSNKSVVDEILSGITSSSTGEVIETELSEVEQAVDTSELYAVVITVIGDSKIDVIKAVRSITGLGLKKAQELVESTPDAVVLRGVDVEIAESAQTELELAGATVMIVDAADIIATCEVGAEAGSMSLVLMDIGDARIDVILAVRSISGEGLKEAEELVESAPDAIILKNSVLEILETAQTQLQDLGATVEIRDTVSDCDQVVTDGSGRYEVAITEVGTAKIDVIKAVRSLTGLGLVEAKDLVESTDAIVLSGVDLAAAEYAQTALETTGATITLTELP